MAIRPLVVAGLAWLVGLSALALVPASAPAQGGERQRIVVGFERPLTTERVEALLATHGASAIARLRHLSAATAQVPRQRFEAVRARLLADGRVRFVARDRRVRLPGIRSALARIARTPDDDGFLTYQHNLYQPSDDDVDATNAWDRRRSCAKVAVVDTGVDTDHRDLRPNLWHNDQEVSGNGKDDDGNGYVDDYRGFDVVRGSGSGIDHNGHGSHVAGIIAAQGDNGRGVAGLCWAGTIVSVRTLDSDGRGWSSDSARGIAYAVDVGARVINASFGSDEPADVERSAIAYARDHGALIVAAAGNSDRDIDSKASYPAAYPDENVIAVAATDDRDRLASFSNWGIQRVDLAAPGVEIASTWDDGDYRLASGTSMAAPLVSAAAALVRGSSSLEWEGMREALLGSVDRVDSLRKRVASGGRLNVGRALDRAAR